jgi:hypothetical protein
MSTEQPLTTAAESGSEHSTSATEHPAASEDPAPAVPASGAHGPPSPSATDAAATVQPTHANEPATNAATPSATARAGSEIAAPPPVETAAPVAPVTSAAAQNDKAHNDVPKPGSAVSPPKKNK